MAASSARGLVVHHNLFFNLPECYKDALRFE